LAICKPAIRRTANVGDWVVGLGSANSPIGNISDHVVYAMKVTDKRGFWGYDLMCQSTYPGKIPDWQSHDFKRRVGDCLYDFSNGTPPQMRIGVHDERNRETDLGGDHVLISNHFYYFGDKPIKLPDSLLPLIHSQQGHKVDSNQPYLEEFVEWLDSLGLELNKLHGDPQFKLEFEANADIRSICAKRDLEDD
jgi:hypothetical protein